MIGKRDLMAKKILREMCSMLGFYFHTFTRLLFTAILLFKPFVETEFGLNNQEVVKFVFDYDILTLYCWSKIRGWFSISCEGCGPFSSTVVASDLCFINVTNGCWDLIQS